MSGGVNINSQGITQKKLQNVGNMFDYLLQDTIGVPAPLALGACAST